MNNIGLSGFVANGKIAKLIDRFNKMNMKELANGMNDIRKNNEKIVEEEER